MKISAPQIKEPFLCSGTKVHRLLQSDNAVLLITERPSEISYIIDYFQWHAIMRSTWNTDLLNMMVLALGNQEEIIIDYDMKKVYKQKHEDVPKTKVISDKLHHVYKYGPVEEGEEDFFGYEYNRP